MQALSRVSTTVAQGQQWSPCGLVPRRGRPKKWRCLARAMPVFAGRARSHRDRVWPANDRASQPASQWPRWVDCGQSRPTANDPSCPSPRTA